MLSRACSPSRRWPGPAGWFVGLLFALAILAPPALAVGAPPPDTLALPYISYVQVGTSHCNTCPPRVCPNEPVRVFISGVLPDGCTSFRGLRELPVAAPFPVLAADFVVDSCGVECPTVQTSFSATFDLPPSVPGNGAFVLLSQVRSCPDTSVVARSGSRQIDYVVLDNCIDPPPLDSLARTLVKFRVVPEPRCERDTISLQLVENNCPPCLNLESFVRDTAFTATVNWTPDCREFRCSPDTLSVMLGQLMAGFHSVLVNVNVRVLGTGVEDSVISFQERVSFDVSRRCDSTQVGCVFPVLLAQHSDQGCAVVVAPKGRATFNLSSQSSLALGGLQGRVHCPEPFRIVDLRSPYTLTTRVLPPGTPDIQVSWVPDGRDARFVLFTTGGVQIPAGTTPVLAVVVECDSGATPGLRTAMLPWLEVASGPFGEDVPLCDISTIRLAGVGLCVGGLPEICDLNFDGRADVRDLVMMTSCLLTDPPGGSPMCRDCNHDGTWTFDDLICCARHILQLPLVPRDSINADDIRVTFEPVASDDQGIFTRVRLTGVQGLGAALLRLRYPGERWQAQVPVSVDTPTASAASEGWLPLVDPEQPGVVQLGGLRLTPTASSDLEFTLRFSSTAPPRAEDEVVVEGADLAGSDGEAFTLAILPRLSLTQNVPVPPPSAPDRVELGAARPNPFSRSTTFTVSLPREAEVDLAVHDLAGRRIATMLSGRVAAGHREVPWNADRVSDGIYFVRLVVDGRVFTQRVAVLRDRR